MGVSIYNLYQNGKVFNVSDTEQLLLRDLLEVEPEITDNNYIIRDGDELDLIAYNFYKGVPNASKYWWVIADVNNILNPLDLSGMVGQTIVIPNLQRILE